MLKAGIDVEPQDAAAHTSIAGLVPAHMCVSQQTCDLRRRVFPKLLKESLPGGCFRYCVQYTGQAAMMLREACRDPERIAMPTSAGNTALLEPGELSSEQRLKSETAQHCCPSSWWHEASCCRCS